MTTTLKAAILTALLVLTPFRAVAEEALTLRAGADFTHYVDQTSIYSIGYENFPHHFGFKIEGGGWTDVGLDRYESPFASALGGVRLGNYDGFNATGFFGFAIIGNPDSALSTPFEFTEEVILGFKNVGVGYKHISNGGIKEPNHGRDYISVTLALPF